jgi:adenosylcobinamide kinase/adenosylcobinamide-phosphate guanylyltransferase
LLIDCGPEIPRAAERHGVSLTSVRALLFSHTHPDHLGPAALLFRHWARRTEPLHIIGPPAALAMCEPWIAPDDPVTMHALVPGDTLHVIGYRITALAANHADADIGPAVLFDIMAPDNSRMLYATDTGPLPESMYAATANAAYDVVLLEETFGPNTTHGSDHLDFATFPTVVARLRQSSAIVSSSRVVAIHLSHHNPSNNVLRERLGEWDVELRSDGDTLRVGAASDGDELAQAPPSRTLIVGGARSGKSVHAEHLLASEPHVTYVATAAARPDDSEWQSRVQAHRARRPDHWRTLESADLAGVLIEAGAGQVLLVDCLTMWLTGVLDDTQAWSGDLRLAHKHIDELLTAWRGTKARVVAVSNEVGWGIVPDTASGRLFRDLQGTLNARLAAESDEVLLLVAGRALRLR